MCLSILELHIMYAYLGYLYLLFEYHLSSGEITFSHVIILANFYWSDMEMLQYAIIHFI